MSQQEWIEAQFVLNAHDTYDAVAILPSGERFELPSVVAKSDGPKVLVSPDGLQVVLRV